MPSVLGLDAKMYYNTGNYTTPVWAEVTLAKDVALNLEKATTDVTTRAANGWRQRRGTLKDSTVTFQMLYDTADAAFTALQTAFFANTLTEFAVMDGDITVAGAQGLRALMDIINFSRTENLEEALMVDVELSAADSVNPPEWYTVP